MIAYAVLPDRALMSVSGQDAGAFLQGIVSNDITKLKEGAAMYAALLTPQGKFLHDFFLYRRGDAILIDVDKERLPDLLQRLSLYKLRSKVNFTPLPESEGVVAVWAQDSGFGIQDSGIIFPDPRLPQLGWRLAGDVESIKTWCAAQGLPAATPEAYDRMRLELGVPDGARDMTDRSLLLEFGFEDLHGVDFGKGCYVGQEVTARSKHRAQLRKYLYQVRSGGPDLPEAGTKITAGDAEVGELRSHSGEVGLAVLRVEEVEKAAQAGVSLKAGDVTIASAAIPGWMVVPPSGGA